jgi:hypothetical protein
VVGLRVAVRSEVVLKTITLVPIIVAAVVLAVWRGVALYRYAFHKKDL